MHPKTSLRYVVVLRELLLKRWRYAEVHTNTPANACLLPPLNCEVIAYSQSKQDMHASKAAASPCEGMQVHACLQTVGYSAMIREAFQGDKGLSGIVRKLPIERQFRLDNVKMVSLSTAGTLHQMLNCPAASLSVSHSLSALSRACAVAFAKHILFATISLVSIQLCIRRGLMQVCISTHRRLPSHRSVGKLMVFKGVWCLLRLA